MIKKKKRKKREQPLALGEQIFAYLEAIGGRREKSKLTTLWENRFQILGQELACQIEKITDKNGLLILTVADAMSMQELSFQSEEILQKVNGFLQSSYFTSVRVTL